MAPRRTEKGSSAPKVATKEVPDLDSLLLQIKHYLMASKSAAEAWQTVRNSVEHGVGFPDVGKAPSDPTSNDRAQLVKEDPMHGSKSGSTATQQIKSAELLELLRTVVDDPDRWLATPTVQFGGRKPIDLVGTTEEPKILDLLHAVEQGIF